MRGGPDLPGGVVDFPVLGLLGRFSPYVASALPTMVTVAQNKVFCGGASLVVAAAPVREIRSPQASPSRRCRLRRRRWFDGIFSCWPVRLWFAEFVGTVASLCSLVLRPRLRHVGAASGVDVRFVRNNGGLALGSAALLVVPTSSPGRWSGLDDLPSAINKGMLALTFERHAAERRPIREDDGGHVPGTSM